MSQDETGATRKRERSNRYPGRPLADGVDLARFIEERGLDGLAAPEIASALGFSNVKTNTFSARLSAARQFGLLSLKDECYSLTPLARAILHPVDPAELPRLYRQALLEPPLYAELANRMGDKKVPEVGILANVLYHQHQIIASAKDAAAETFLDSARFADALGDDGVFRPRGIPAPAEAPRPAEPPTDGARPAPPPGGVVAPSRPPAPGVRIDLPLWGADRGKSIRVRAPEQITPESFERLLQTIKLHVRIEAEVPKPEPEMAD